MEPLVRGNRAAAQRVVRKLRFRRGGGPIRRTSRPNHASTERLSDATPWGIDRGKSQQTNDMTEETKLSNTTGQPQGVGIRALFAIALAAALCGCDMPKTEYSPTLTEEGEIYDTAYIPAGHGSDTAVGFNTGKGGGVTITPVSIDIPERYAVVFKCQHGKFVIAGEKAKGLYQRFERGDKCTIEYREVIRVEMKDGKEVSRSVYDLDFLDAKKHQEAEKAP